MTELFLVQTFMFEFSGLPSIPKTLPRRVRLSVERAAKFHVTPLDQELDLDKLKKWVAVVDEEHDLNRDQQREGMVRWLWRICSGRTHREDAETMLSTTHRIVSVATTPRIHFAS